MHAGDGAPTSRRGAPRRPGGVQGVVAGEVVPSPAQVVGQAPGAPGGAPGLRRERRVDPPAARRVGWRGRRRRRDGDETTPGGPAEWPSGQARTACRRRMPKKMRVTIQPDNFQGRDRGLVTRLPTASATAAASRTCGPRSVSALARTADPGRRRSPAGNRPYRPPRQRRRFPVFPHRSPAGDQKGGLGSISADPRRFAPRRRPKQIAEGRRPLRARSPVPSLPRTWASVRASLARLAAVRLLYQEPAQRRLRGLGLPAPLAQPSGGRRRGR